VFAEIAQTTNSKGKPQSPSALNHLRTTLRAALNLAVREELIDSNPARHIEIAGYRRPYAQVWTEGRVEHWELTGEHPAVAVWTAAQIGLRGAPTKKHLRRNGLSARSEAAGHAAAAPVPSRKVTTPMCHAHAAQPLQRPNNEKGLNRVSAVQASIEEARPKGLEPLTI
jgi:hypothetical protein